MTGLLGAADEDAGSESASAVGLGVSCRHLRKYARENRLGRGCPPRLKSALLKHSALTAASSAQIEAFASLVRERLAGGEESECTKIEIGQDDITVAATGRVFVPLRVVKSFEIEGEGFGEVEERESKRVHSFVERSTGGILLPRAKGANEALGPQLEYGFRANVSDADSGASALNKTGEMISFVGSVMELVALGVDPNGTNSFKETALMQAAVHGHLDVCRVLCEVASIDAGTDAGATALMKAVECGDDFAPIVKLLIEKGADVNKCNKWGMTALHLAAYLGYENLVRELVAAGAEIDLEDSLAKTPLDYASQEFCRRNDYGEPDHHPEIESILHEATEK